MSACQNDVLGLALDRRQPRRPHELLAGELVEAVADLVALALAHRLECACPEHLADDRRVLEQRFRGPAEACRAARR